MINNLVNEKSNNIDIHSEESRKAAATMIINLFELWQLDTTTQLNLLGLSPKSCAELDKYRTGTPLPNNRNILDRVGWLLACHKTLGLLYPGNTDLRYQWISKYNDAFANHPIEVMTEQGLIGITRVSHYLDYMRE